MLRKLLNEDFEASNIKSCGRSLSDRVRRMMREEEKKAEKDRAFAERAGRRQAIKRSFGYTEDDE